MPAQEVEIKEIQKILDFASALGDSILSMTVNCTNTRGDTPLIVACAPIELVVSQAVRKVGIWSVALPSRGL